MGCPAVPSGRHPLHHLWQPSSGQQGIQESLPHPGWHLTAPGAWGRPRACPAPCLCVSSPPGLLGILPCVCLSVVPGMKWSVFWKSGKPEHFGRVLGLFWYTGKVVLQNRSVEL